MEDGGSRRGPSSRPEGSSFDKRSRPRPGCRLLPQAEGAVQSGRWGGSRSGLGGSVVCGSGLRTESGTGRVCWFCTAVGDGLGCCQQMPWRLVVAAAWVAVGAGDRAWPSAVSALRAEQIDLPSPPHRPDLLWLMRLQEDSAGSTPSLDTQATSLQFPQGGPAGRRVHDWRASEEVEAGLQGTGGGSDRAAGGGWTWESWGGVDRNAAPGTQRGQQVLRGGGCGRLCSGRVPTWRAVEKAVSSRRQDQGGWSGMEVGGGQSHAPRGSSVQAPLLPVTMSRRGHSGEGEASLTSERPVQP